MYLYTAQSAEYSLYTGLPSKGKLLRDRQPVSSSRQNTGQRTAMIGGQRGRNNKGQSSEQHRSGKEVKEILMQLHHQHSEPCSVIVYISIQI